MLAYSLRKIKMTDSSIGNRLPGSFRDPSGFLFYSDGILFRQVNHVYKDNYDRLFSSGLYDALVDSELLIPHQDIDIEPPAPNDAYKLLKPEVIDFISTNKNNPFFISMKFLILNYLQFYFLNLILQHFYSLFSKPY